MSSHERFQEFGQGEITPTQLEYIQQLQEHGAELGADPSRNRSAFVATFRYEGGAKATMRIVMNDVQSGVDVTITNMTVLPAEKEGGGYGSDAVARILEWARKSNFDAICATQVSSDDSKRFWKRNGFSEVEGSSLGDFAYWLKNEA